MLASESMLAGAHEVKIPVDTALEAVCVLKGGYLIQDEQSGKVTEQAITGLINFVDNPDTGKVMVAGLIRGLKPDFKHGIHIHEFGDWTNGCASAGAHFNPTSVTHGGPKDKVRHVGDLGNIQTNKDGVAEFEFEDAMIKLSGPLSIVGRSLVVHANADDYGTTSHPNSKTTGNSGDRWACGVIGIRKIVTLAKNTGA